MYNPHGLLNPDGASPPGCPFLRTLYVCPQAIHLKPGSVCLHRRKLMESTKDTKLGGLQSTFSRRNLLKGAAALAAAASVPEAFGQQPTGAPRGTVWLYIGTYTNVASGGSGGNGAGDLLMRAQSFHGEVNRLEARSSWFAGHGDERIHSEPVHPCHRPRRELPVCGKRNL